MSELTDKITISESNLSPATKTEYLFRLKQFYRFSPIKNDDELIDCPSDELQKIIVNYARTLIKRVENNDLSANTIPKMFRGIRWLLNSNYRENDIKWKPIEALFPKSVKRSGYKAWSSEQIQIMLDNTSFLRNKSIIHFQASTGGMIGIHDHPLLMQHLIEMDWNGYKCYAVLLYADYDETIEEKDLRDKQDDVQGGDSYWSFLTPEASDCLDKYFDERKRRGELLTPDRPIFSQDTLRLNIDSKQVSDTNITALIYRIISNIPELSRRKKGRRYDIQMNHGFRKRMNTILKLESEVNSNIAETRENEDSTNLEGESGELAPISEIQTNYLIIKQLATESYITSEDAIILENKMKNKTLTFEGLIDHIKDTQLLQVSTALPHGLDLIAENFHTYEPKDAINIMISLSKLNKGFKGLRTTKPKNWFPASYMLFGVVGIINSS